MFRVMNPQTKKEMEEYYRLRWLLLRRPLGGKRGTEIDEFESDSFHRAIVNNQNMIIGVGRMHFVEEYAQIRYMGIKKMFWKKGLGTKLITKFESIAKKHRIRTIFLNSRVSVLDFYSKNGFSIIKKANPSFGSIIHYRMEKVLEKS